MSEQHTGFEAVDVPITLGTGAKTYLELRPDLDFETVRANGKPTWVTRGVIGGFSLPIYAADNEELHFNTHVPQRWDGASDITAHAHCYLDTANTDKKFQLRLEWEHVTYGGSVIPDTNNDVDVETDTGTAAQYKTFVVEFTIDYDIDGSGNEVDVEDSLSLRLTRIAASETEIAGEVVITHLGIIFRRDKVGEAV